MIVSLENTDWLPHLQVKLPSRRGENPGGFFGTKNCGDINIYDWLSFPRMGWPGERLDEEGTGSKRDEKSKTMLPACRMVADGEQVVLGY